MHKAQVAQQAAVEKRIQLPERVAVTLSNLSQARHISEDEIVEKALTILFSLTDLLDTRAEEQTWSGLSEASLHLIWDNDEDAAYDNWRELYGVSER